MPIIKSITHDGASSIYHTIPYVEFYHKDTGLCWRGKFQSFSSAGPVTPPLHTGVELGVPVSAPSSDPIEAFERACIASPGSIFYGGEYVEPGAGGSSLMLERAVAWQRVKQGRDAHLGGGVETAYGRFDSDLVSIVNILGAAAALPEGATVPWILQNNSQVTLTKDQVTEVGSLLAAFRSAAYSHGSTLRAQIDSAQTVEDVRAIAWTPPV